MSPEFINIGGTAINDKVRLALLQIETHVTILLNNESLNEESEDLNHSKLDLLPGQLFDLSVKKIARHHLLDASIVCAEGSVSFLPHPSLPVIRKASPKIDDYTHGCTEEVSFYGNLYNVTLNSALPLNSILNDEMSVLISKLICVAFDALQVYERVGKKSEAGSSLFSIPFRKFSFQHNSSKAQQTDWPMAQTYALNAAAVLVKDIAVQRQLFRDQRNECHDWRSV